MSLDLPRPVRVFTPADLESVAGLIPLPLVPATGDTAVRLER